MPEGQSELFDPPATRRLIARHGGWWGIDPSTRRVSLCCVHRAPGADFYVRQVATEGVPSRSGAELLGCVRFAATKLASEWAKLTAPGVVVVEQPSGKTPNPMLSYAVGVVVEAVWRALTDEFGEAPAIETVASSRWKKVACGSGAIYKPKPSERREYGVLTWARENGYEGSLWDEADAWAIAEYARKTIALDVR